MTHDITIKNINNNSPAIPCENVPSKGLQLLGKKKLRFQKIESQHYYENYTHVQDLLKLLNKAQQLKLPPEEKRAATFFIANTHKGKVYGGAVLLKQQVRNRKKNCGSHYAFQGEKIWTCRFILNLATKDPLFMSDKQRIFCSSLYEELYQILEEFGREVDATLMWVTLDPEEYDCLDFLGRFPFMIKMNPQDTTDGLFHGLLPLTDEFARACVVPENWTRPPQYKLIPQEGEIRP